MAEAREGDLNVEAGEGIVICRVYISGRVELELGVSMANLDSGLLLSARLTIRQ